MIIPYLRFGPTEATGIFAIRVTAVCRCSMHRAWGGSAFGWSTQNFFELLMKRGLRDIRAHQYCDFIFVLDLLFIHGH